MAVDSYLKLGTIKGESVAKGFEDQIQVHRWNWAMTQTGTTHTGTGGGAGKVSVHDLTFTHHVDAATPNLVLSCCKGTHHDSAVLTMRKAGGAALEYVTLTLTDVIVTAVSHGGGHGDDLLTEDVSLNFAKFKFSYQPQDAKGAKKGGAVDATFDIAKLQDS